MRIGLAVGALLGIALVQGCEREDEKKEPEAPMALVFVMEGDATWIGNVDYEPDPNAQYPGRLQLVELGIDKADLARRLPVGSRVAIVTYADTATIRMPLAPVAELRGSSFGTQIDYKGRKGNDAMKGIAAGLDLLSRARARVKLMVVLTDGTTGDGSEEAINAAKQPLAELKQRAEKMNIVIQPIVIVPNDFGPILFNWGHVVNSVEGVYQDLVSLMREYAPTSAQT